MELLRSVKTILYLLIATILLILSSLMTEKPVFLWAALIVSVGLFLNLYWFGISVIAYFIQEKHPTPLQDIRAFFDRDTRDAAPGRKRKRSQAFSDFNDQISD